MPGTQLLALTLARALDLELSNTIQICSNALSLRSTLAYELAETEAILDGTQREIAVLRSRLRPINQLPPELLVYIFSFLGGGAEVVPASHVCKRWRDIALGTPSLWAVISEDDDLPTALCFMERSCPMPLDISFPIFMREDGLQPFLSLGHTARIRRLHFHVFGDRVYDFYCLLATMRDSIVLPALEHFSIRMSEFGFRDDSRDGDLPRSSFFPESRLLTHLTFRASLPLETHLSPAITSLTLVERAFDLDALLACLAAAPNLEYLALLNSVPHTFKRDLRLSSPLVSLARLKELHWFQVWIFDNLLGTVKLFEHLDMPNLSTTQFVLLLDPSRYSFSDLYPPSHRAVYPFGIITELHLEASHYTPGKPARNNIVVHGRRDNETLFSIRLHRGSLDAFCACPDGDRGIALTSSLRVDVANLTQLTFTSAFLYSWARFFRKPEVWSRFLRALPAVKVLRLLVSNPIHSIIAPIAAATDDDGDAVLPELQVLHLFRNGSNRAGPSKVRTYTGDTDALVCCDEEGRILLRFLRRRADLGRPIGSIVCSPEDAAALPPEALTLVDSVELGTPGAWTEPLFPKRMIPLLEENLD